MIAAILSLLIGGRAGAASSATLADYRTCQSAVEFKKAHRFLGDQKDLTIKDAQIVPFAIEISRGCDGAAARFAKVYLLLKTAGVDQIQALKTALSFAPLENVRVDGFAAVFQKIFLENYLNLDFNNAFRLSLELTRDYQGDVKRLKDDFVEMVKYCLDEKNGLGLNFTFCAEYTIGLTKYAELFPKGVHPEVRRLYDFLRFDKRTGLNIQDALGLIPRVLARGPTAPANFVETMKYALEHEHIKATPLEALKIAMSVAESSLATKSDVKK